MIETLSITKPDDWHLHLRDGDLMRVVLPYTVAQFARAIVMPNLAPPVVTADDARAYRQRILSCIPLNADFTPLMTAYLTDDTDPEDLRVGISDGVISAVKMIVWAVNTIVWRSKRSSVAYCSLSQDDRAQHQQQPSLSKLF